MENKKTIDEELKQSANEVAAQLKDNEVITTKEKFGTTLKDKKEQAKQATLKSIEISKQAAKTINDEDLCPIHIKNKDTQQLEPHCVVGDKYVPYDEAQIIFQERRVEREKLKLEKLKKLKLEKLEKLKNKNK